VRARLLAVAAGGLLLAACGGGQSAGPATPATHTPSAPARTATPAPTPTTDPVAAMSLEQKIGQLMMVGVAGPSLPAPAAQAFTRYRFGSVVLTDGNNNGGSAASARQLGQAIRGAEGPGPAPILTTNQEGGTVCFRSTGMRCPPGQREQGASGSAQVVTEDTTQTAQDLRGLGFSSGLAPDADVWDGTSPFMADRSYGTDPAAVSRLVTASVAADHAQGLLAVAKHFPGHGSAGDSHLYLPTVQHDLATLQRVDLPPFRAAVQAEVDMIMTGHLLVPALDPNLPTSLSPRTAALARETLGYQGVLITDDLIMQAITDRFGVEQAALLALQAGQDVVMYSGSMDVAVRTLGFLVTAVQQGKLPAAQVDQSVRRVLALKSRHGLAS
jgi:beta-N-acetylhexosaminidase